MKRRRRKTRAAVDRQAHRIAKGMVERYTAGRCNYEAVDRRLWKVTILTRRALGWTR